MKNMKVKGCIKDFEEDYTQRLNGGNIVRLKLSRLRTHRLRLFMLKPL